jgi:hypothetical protein
VSFDFYMGPQRVRDAIFDLLAGEAAYERLHARLAVFQPLLDLARHIVIARFHALMIDCFHARRNR